MEDIEGEAGWILDRWADDREPPDVLELAQKLTGAPVVTIPHRGLPGDAMLATVHGHRRIYMRSGLPGQRLRWAVAHELGHLVLGLDSSTQENEEACDAFAAALLVPRRAYRIALVETGDDYTNLARWFGTSESCVALRYGEVTDEPLALIVPSRVYVRGFDFAWPEESDLRSVALLPGVRKARLRDDRRRVAMLASQASACARSSSRRHFEAARHELQF